VLLSPKEDWNPVICSKMDELEDMLSEKDKKTNTGMVSLKCGS
jgi:hypothetical protein